MAPNSTIPVVSPPLHIRTHRFPVDCDLLPSSTFGDPKKDAAVHLFRHCWFFPRLGDLDGDGSPELLYNRGASQQLAYKTNGTLLWSHTDRSLPDSLVRVDSPMPVYDFDGDGVAEVICVRAIEGRPHLAVVRAADGVLLRTSPEPIDMRGGYPTDDKHLSIVPAQLEGRGKPWDILLHKDYNYIAAYRWSDLTLKWKRPVPDLALGHTTCLADINGDGREELYYGVGLLNPDGTDRWFKPELLEGTGEPHPDTAVFADFDGDGVTDIFFGPGARRLDLDGNIVWTYAGDLTEVQRVVVFQAGNGAARLAITDQPFSGKAISWRGIPGMRDVRSVIHVVDAEGKKLFGFEAMHTPLSGDWNGDGQDELIALNRDGNALEVWTGDGACIERIPIQDRVYISDLIAAPVLPGARAAQLVLTEWSEDFSTAETVIYENLNSLNQGKSFDPLRAARDTPY